MRRYPLLLAVCTAVFAACEPDDDVGVLPLPELERPSPEARLGLPEIAGTWRFAGWEVIRGDTTALERTFPSFGELGLTQRLDSIAGSFLLAGGRTPVIGEVRRNGVVSFVTFGDGAAQRYVAGEVSQDTLWLELTSVLAPDEWPQDARAAFVREPVAEPIAWLRGARPADEVPGPVADSLPPITGSLVVPPTGAVGVPGQPGQPPAGVSPAAPPQPRPGAATPGPATPRPTTPQPAPVTPQQPRPQQPAPATPQQPRPQQPAPTTPQQPRPQQPAPPPPPPPADRDPEPEPEPAPEPDVERPSPPVLLGDPVDP